ncbi:MAG: lasso peptide biosynthesis B2 protein [Pseudomonadota bacterium]
MKRITAPLRKLMALSSADRRTLFAAAACMPLFWLGLRVLGLPRFQALLRRTHLTVQTAMSLGEIQTLGNLVNVAARHTLGPRSCLTRSLLLTWLLGRRGVTSQLRIGVRLEAGTLRAHAWVECEGAPVNDQPEIGAQFASFGDLLPMQAFRTP